MIILLNKNFVIIKDEEFRAFGQKSWVGSNTECHLFLSILPYISDKNELLEDNHFSLEFQNQFSKMCLCDLMKLAFTLRYNGTYLNYVNWENIILILLNPQVSKCLLLFIKENYFYEKIDKKEIIKGIIYAFKKKIMLFIEDKSFKNLFNLLNVESFISYPIIKATLLQPSDFFFQLF